MQEAKSRVFAAQQELDLALLGVKQSLICGNLGMAQVLPVCHCQDSSKLPARDRRISLHSLRLAGLFGGFVVNLSAPGATYKDKG